MWIKPKTNWIITDRFNFYDYNRIKNNILYVKEQLEIYRGFIDTVDMGEDIDSYTTYWDVNVFNAFEKNLEILNKNALNKNIGTTKTYYENGLFIDYVELNRIESVTLDLYDIAKGMGYGIRRLPFRFGQFKSRL